MVVPHAQQRRLKNLLVDVRYQLSFSLPVVAVAAALLVGLGYVAIDKVDSATKIGVNETELGGALLTVADGTRDALMRRAELITDGIVLGGVLLCFGLLLFGLWITHRVAGPLHRVAVELDALAAGRPGRAQALRKGDLLTAFYRQFSAALATLRARDEREVEVWRRVAAAVGKEGSVAKLAASERFRARLSEKEAALG